MFLWCFGHGTPFFSHWYSSVLFFYLDHQRDEIVGMAVVPEVDDEGLVLGGPAFEFAVDLFGRFVDVEVAVLVGIDLAAVVFSREYHSVFVWLHFRNFWLRLLA